MRVLLCAMSNPHAWVCKNPTSPDAIQRTTTYRRAKDPKNIIEKQPHEENHAHFDIAQRQLLNATHTKCHGEQIVGQPMALPAVEGTDSNTRDGNDCFWQCELNLCRLLGVKGWYTCVCEHCTNVSLHTRLSVPNRPLHTLRKGSLMYLCMPMLRTFSGSCGSIKGCNTMVSAITPSNPK